MVIQPGAFLKTLMRLGLALAVWAAAASAARADYQQGLSAFGEGRFEVAIEEFFDLAERGHPGAEFMLGVMYFNGAGVAQDSQIAAIFFYQAAQQGEAGAQLALGSIYIRGVGVGQDLVQARTWLSLAAINGTDELQRQAIALRDATSLLMTPEEIAEAGRLTRNWGPRPWGLVRGR